MKLTQAAERVHKEAEQDKDGHWITWKSAIWLKCGSRVSIRVIELSFFLAVSHSDRSVREIHAALMELNIASVGTNIS